MRRIILLLFFSSRCLFATIYCCCDDAQNILDSEQQSVTDITNNVKEIRSKTKERVGYYETTLKNSNGLLIVGSRAFVSAKRLRDAISMKENFEGLSASTTLDGSRVDSAIAAGALRGEIGREAENFAAQRNGK